jgi:hypothetical protein
MGGACLGEAAGLQGQWVFVVRLASGLHSCYTGTTLVWEGLVDKKKTSASPPSCVLCRSAILEQQAQQEVHSWGTCIQGSEVDAEEIFLKQKPSLPGQELTHYLVLTANVIWSAMLACRAALLKTFFHWRK